MLQGLGQLGKPVSDCRPFEDAQLCQGGLRLVKRTVHRRKDQKIDFGGLEVGQRELKNPRLASANQHIR